MINDNDFERKIREINHFFSFVSLGANLDQYVNKIQHSGYCFRMNGVMSHRIGAISSGNSKLIRHLSLYDSKLAAASECNVTSLLGPYCSH